MGQSLGGPGEGPTLEVEVGGRRLGPGQGELQQQGQGQCEGALRCPAASREARFSVERAGDGHWGG